MRHYVRHMYVRHVCVCVCTCIRVCVCVPAKHSHKLRHSALWVLKNSRASGFFFLKLSAATESSAFSRAYHTFSVSAASVNRRRSKMAKDSGSSGARVTRHWNVLQCVAVCCSVLQCVAVCCSVLQCVAACCSALQCVAMCCTVLRSVVI